MDEAAVPKTGAFEPLRYSSFRRFWVSNVASTFGSMIQTVGAAWLMAALTNDAQMVALVQTFATLPMMLLSLPAGALADNYDRRWIMLGAQLMMLVAAAGVAAASYVGLASPGVLLLGTFIIGGGMALNGPSWQASVAEQVPRRTLDLAISLNSVGFNLARSLGPAMGGLIVAAAGATTAFTVNAISYLGLIATLLVWRPPPRHQALPPEALGRAISTGVRYAAMSPSLLAIMLRGGAYGLCGSCVWALTAVLARDGLHAGPGTYGVLLAAFGGGAVVGALARSHLPLQREQIVRICTILFGVSSGLLGLSGSLAWSVPLMALAGGAWVTTLTSLSASVQMISPSWVVGRAIATNQIVIFASMALGSWLWGMVASAGGIRWTFVASGIAMLATLVLAPLLPIRAEPADLTPRYTGPIDDLEGPVGAGEGPIVMQIEYCVPPENADAFVTAMAALGRIRRRDGALRWTLAQDVEDATRWIERFHSLTWLDHLRRQTRSTVADQSIRDRVAALHDGQLLVRRLIERGRSTLGAFEDI